MGLADVYENDLPLLAVMATPGTVFYEALKLFRRRALYANACGDRTVPFCSASIRRHNIYRSVPRDQLYGTARP